MLRLSGAKTKLPHLSESSPCASSSSWPPSIFHSLIPLSRLPQARTLLVERNASDQTCPPCSGRISGGSAKFASFQSLITPAESPVASHCRSDENARLGMGS